MQRWEAPEDGWIKGNADGAVAKQRNNGGGGVILRDHQGAFLAAAGFFFPHCTDPEGAEIRACLELLRLARNQNVQRILVELDCQAAVQMINSQERNLSAVGPWVQEIKGLLEEFLDFRVVWTRRSANEAAHKLARVSVGDERSRVWVGVPPDFILDIVANDIPNLF
ncbi:uncharacterized protein [Aegilops tauschii subsp. strangulata]|uniref:uncharacterized protein n=1 Tax=Aegilops tauschii subsp. strangulata TaxID=200361 RepID=UPI003CC886E9